MMQYGHVKLQSESGEELQGYCSSHTHTRLHHEDSSAAIGSSDRMLEVVWHVVLSSHSLAATANHLVMV